VVRSAGRLSGVASTCATRSGRSGRPSRAAVVCRAGHARRAGRSAGRPVGDRAVRARPRLRRSTAARSRAADADPRRPFFGERLGHPRAGLLQASELGPCAPGELRALRPLRRTRGGSGRARRRIRRGIHALRAPPGRAFPQRCLRDSAWTHCGIAGVQGSEPRRASK
jgi:hypothetical protein